MKYKLKFEKLNAKQKGGSPKKQQSRKTVPDSPFIKYLENHSVEYDISQLIFSNPHKNLVKILESTTDYIIMEKLIIRNPRDDEIEKYFNDIKEGLDHLSSIGVSYIDLKNENICYSTEDDSWKIFDFDMSGILNDNGEWINEPQDYLIYNLLKQENLKPIDYNMFLFEKFTEKGFQEGYNYLL